MAISEVVMENENTWRSETETKKGILQIWQTMRECIYRVATVRGNCPAPSCKKKSV